MSLGFIRALFVLISSVVGLQVGIVLAGPKSEYGFYGLILGAVFSLLIIAVEKLSSKVSLRGLSAAVFGLLLALIISNLLSSAIDTIDMSLQWKAAYKLILLIVLSYLGIVFGIRGRDEFAVVIPYVKFQRQEWSEYPIVMDTSAIIDGRISEVVKCSFLEGYFVIPKFVLKELHQLCDSGDAEKRERGRRGLDVLSNLRKESRFRYRIHAEEYDEVEGVDQKLIKLARILGAKLITTDHALNKLAEFHNVTTLNINELANSLKPVLMPGDILQVKLIREGKEPNQAVAYLNDGTMVVVEDGADHIGKSIEVKVSSLLQTPAGRMVFAAFHVGADA
ncbi:MAG: hypothetical protein KC649_05400 [Candidatus Omnitrophica bacterium]|nr:hypothetical protein [Candidatus Omnitrophota bacterium]